MRQCIDGNGNDSTAAVRAWLASNRQLFCADLFQFQTFVQGESWSHNDLLTTFDRPLTWSHVGTFVPACLKRGTVESKVGLDVATLEIEWNLRDTDGFVYESFSGEWISLLRSFNLGLWDNGRASLYRAVMPVPGDCNTLGAMTLFSGRMAEITTMRTGVKIKINALTEVFDTQVPTNLIEPNNVQAQYGLGQPPAGLGGAPVFTVANGSTPTMLLGACISPNAGQIFGADTFDFGYVQFNSGTSLGRIYRSVWVSGTAYGKNMFRLYEPLPWMPAVGEQFTAYVPYARNSNAGTGTFQGFPYVPPPETAT
jgi:hypothetical protein